MPSRAICSSFPFGGLLILAALAWPQGGSAQESSWTGNIIGQYIWNEYSRSSSDSFTMDEGECNSEVNFFAYGWLRYRYAYYRVATQTWSYVHRPPHSTPYREDTRRTTYVSGRLINRTSDDTTTAAPSPKPITDIIKADQRVQDYTDGSMDVVYRYPHRIPVTILEEVTHIGWDGKSYRETPRWRQGSVQCEPHVLVWSQQTRLRQTQGSFDGLSGDIRRQLPGTGRWIWIRWNLQRDTASVLD